MSPQTLRQKPLLGLISQIQCEQIRLHREQRTTARQKLCLPVKIRFSDSKRVVDAVSKDLSIQGAGLLTTEPIEVGTVSILEFQRETTTGRIEAECKWCQKFGDTFWVTGWELVRLADD